MQECWLLALSLVNRQRLKTSRQKQPTYTLPYRRPDETHHGCKLANDEVSEVCTWVCSRRLLGGLGLWIGVTAVFLLTCALQPESDTLPLSLGNTSVHSAGIP